MFILHFLGINYRRATMPILSIVAFFLDLFFVAVMEVPFV